MKLLWFFLFCMVLVGNNSEIILHEPLPKDTKIIESKQMNLVMTSAGSLQPAKEVRLKNIVFQVVLDSKNNVSFVQTFDKTFQTADVIKTGDRYVTIKRKLKAGTYEPGFSYYFKSNSDWYISFLDNHILETGEIADTCKVISFFKR